MNTMQTLGISNLSLDDRIDLIDELWFSVARDLDDTQMNEMLANDLRERLEEFRANPKAGKSWDELMNKLYPE